MKHPIFVPNALFHSIFLHWDSIDAIITWNMMHSGALYEPNYMNWPLFFKLSLSHCIYTQILVRYTFCKCIHGMLFIFLRHSPFLMLSFSPYILCHLPAWVWVYQLWNEKLFAGFEFAVASNLCQRHLLDIQPSTASQIILRIKYPYVCPISSHTYLATEFKKILCVQIRWAD